MAGNRTLVVAVGCSGAEVEEVVVEEVEVGCVLPVDPGVPELDLGSSECVDIVPGGVRSGL